MAEGRGVGRTERDVTEASAGTGDATVGAGPGVRGAAAPRETTPRATPDATVPGATADAAASRPTVDAAARRAAPAAAVPRATPDTATSRPAVDAATRRAAPGAAVLGATADAATPRAIADAVPDATQASATERAYAAILGGILDGAHAPGAMLAEVALAEAIGVSRTPVRTALARLQDDGWITIYPKRGALVRGLDDRQVEDLMAARLVLESASVQAADAAALVALAARLERVLGAQCDHLARGDMRSFIESTIAFHRSFVEAGGNSVVLELYDRLANRQRFVLYRYGETLQQRCAAIIAEHEGLIALLRAGDTAAFAEALRQHLRDTYRVPLRAG